MEFEHGSADPITTFGYSRTPEQLERERVEKAEQQAEIAEFLAEQRKKNEAADAAERRRMQSRAEGLLKAQAVEICMTANPNLDEVDAKYLYEHKLKDLISIRRFEEAFFGNLDKVKEMFSDLRM